MNLSKNQKVFGLLTVAIPIILAIFVSLTFLLTDTYKYTNSANPSTLYEVTFNDLTKVIHVKTSTVSSGKEYHVTNTINSTRINRNKYKLIRETFKNKKSVSDKDELYAFIDKVAREEVNVESIEYTDGHFVYQTKDSANYIIKAEFTKEYMDAVGLSQDEMLDEVQENENKVYSYEENPDGSIRVWIEAKNKEFWLNKIDKELQIIQKEGAENECTFEINDDKTIITMIYKQADLYGYRQNAVEVCKTYQLFNGVPREQINVDIQYK